MPAPTTRTLLYATRTLITDCGLHTGEQLIGDDGALDVIAAAYIADTGTIPTAFFHDEVAAMDLIRSNPRVMDALAWLSASIDAHLGADPTPRPDPAEHVSHWAATPSIGETTPPSFLEVIGRLTRASTAADTGRRTSHRHAA